MPFFPKTFDGRITVSLRETAVLLGVPAKTIYNCLSTGSFPLTPIRIGRFIFFSVDQLQTLALHGHIRRKAKGRQR